MQQDEDESGADEAPVSFNSNEADASKAKPPIVQLASAMQSGMEAIVASMSARAPSDYPVRQLASAIQVQTDALKQQHEETRWVQQL